MIAHTLAIASTCYLAKCLKVGVSIKWIKKHQNSLKQCLVLHLMEWKTCSCSYIKWKHSVYMHASTWQLFFSLNYLWSYFSGSYIQQIMFLFICSIFLTTVVTAPGFCVLRTFTTWNTSTTPSVLHCSMVVAMAQNIPERLTVSLQGKWSTIKSLRLISEYCSCVTIRY